MLSTSRAADVQQKAMFSIALGGSCASECRIVWDFRWQFRARPKQITIESARRRNESSSSEIPAIAPPAPGSASINKKLRRRDPAQPPRAWTPRAPKWLRIVANAICNNVQEPRTRTTPPNKSDEIAGMSLELGSVPHLASPECRNSRCATDTYDRNANNPRRNFSDGHVQFYLSARSLNAGGKPRKRYSRALMFSFSRVALADRQH